MPFTTLINATGRLKCWKEGNEIMIGRGLSPHVQYLINNAVEVTQTHKIHHNYFFVQLKKPRFT